MPVLLNQTPQNQSTVVCVPKFFDEKFTGKGNGSTVGLLSDKNRPNIDTNMHTNVLHADAVRRSIHNGDLTTHQIPLAPLVYNAQNKLSTRHLDSLMNYNKVATIASTTGNFDLYMRMDVNAVFIEELKTSIPGSTSYSTQTTPVFNYVLSFFAIRPGTVTPVDCINFNEITPRNYDMNALNAKDIGIAFRMYTDNPAGELNSVIVPRLMNSGWHVDPADIMSCLNQFDLYANISELSTIWQTTIDQHMDYLFMHHNGQIDDFDIVYQQVRHLMDYNIPLDLYRNIYKVIQKNFAPDKARIICKQNLNLMLSDTLNDLDSIKSQIPTFNPPAPGTTLPISVQKLSTAQTKAVKSLDPLIMVQAGAGTGKSTMLLGRIAYLTEACGVDPQDITVLSFTNAAADHIKEKNPNVHSMTIARMIHEIYTTNYTNHELSSLETLANTIEIYYPNMMPHSIQAQFRRHLYNLIKGDSNSFTDMNNFIEENYDEVINTLNKIQQTTLELEIIICYQQIQHFIEPPTVASKYLIIDEVQDNSIFEFVYMLKYVTKHLESLFIVGDCSQTLYEFRASNPKALNILESSGTFATFQLNTNYRSTQCILDFANKQLDRIEANRYAQIQLKSTQMQRETEQEFLDTVTLNYFKLHSGEKLELALPVKITTEVAPYIDECRKRGEPVTILAYRKRDIQLFQKTLETLYPGCTCVNLVPQTAYNRVVMSSYIRKFWDQVKFMPLTDLAVNIKDDIMQKLNEIDKKAATNRTMVEDMLKKWINEQGGHIQSWVDQMNAGQLTNDALFDLVKENMLQFEIRNNAIKQALLAAHNQQMKQQNATVNADFQLSTIHSAKGLEFQNVIVLYHNKNNMPEDEKRMYYVAMTRAMKTEYVLAYDTVASPQIEADYLAVCAELHAISPSPNSPIKNRPVKTSRKSSKTSGKVQI